MPFLIINYGAEMIFILEQRLHAQNVKAEKAAKVLADVTKSMFAPQFVQELMRAQELYNATATREVFDHLAQSSIMRLSENSMDKLYDLMTMGCKFQMISCKYPLELLELTLNHLDAVKEAVKGTPSEQFLQGATDQLVRLCGSFTSGVLADIRHMLLNFYQDRRVKVSLFLSDGLQNPDGTFVLGRGGEVTRDPPVQQVGVIRYFDANQIAQEERFAHPDAQLVRPASKVLNALEPTQRLTQLGKNLYMSERKKTDASSASPKAAAPAPAPKQDVPLSQTASLSKSGQGSPLSKRTSFRQRSAVGGSFASSGDRTGSNSLNSLSALIAAQAPKEAMKISLFDEKDDGSDPAGPGVAPMIEIARLSRDDVVKANSELMGIVSGLEVQPSSGAAKADAGQDLLDLMDGQ